LNSSNVQRTEESTQHYTEEPNGESFANS